MRDHLLAFLASALSVVWAHAALASPLAGAPLEDASTLAVQTLIVLALGCLTSGALWSRAPTVFATPRREILGGVWLFAGLIGLLIWNERATFAQLHGYPEALLILAPTALALHSQVSFVLFLTAHGAVIALALALRPSGPVALAFVLLATTLVASLAERSARERFPLRAREESRSQGARTLRGALVPLVALVLAFVGFAASKPAAEAATTEDWIRWLQSGRESRAGGYRIGDQVPGPGTQGPGGERAAPRPTGPPPAPEAVAPKVGPARIGFSSDVKFGDIAGGDRSVAFYARVRTEHGGPIDPVTFRPYWQGGALSRYAEGRWEAEGGETLQRPPRLVDPGRGALIQQQIVLEGAGERALFALYPPVQTELAAVLLDGEGCLRRAPAANSARYSITSRLASRRGLDRAQIEVPDLRYLSVPLTLERAAAFAEIVAEAQAAGASSLVQIYATQRILGERYRYSLTPKLPEDQDPTLAFLEKGKGYCQHFASAMVLLLRSQGIPARVGIGYAGGEWRLKGGYYVVRQKNAHAWVEVPFAGRGWVIFDPASVALSHEESSGPAEEEDPTPSPGSTSPRPRGTPGQIRPDASPKPSPSSSRPPRAPSPPASTPAPVRPSPSRPRSTPRPSPSRPRSTPKPSPSRPQRVRPTPRPAPSRTPRKRPDETDPFERIWTHAAGAVGSAPPAPPPGRAGRPGGAGGAGGRGGAGGVGGAPSGEASASRRPTGAPGAEEARRSREAPEHLARDTVKFAFGSLARDLGWGLGGILILALGVAFVREWRQRRGAEGAEGEAEAALLRYGADDRVQGGASLEELHAANAVVSAYLDLLKGLAEDQSRRPAETARELSRRLDLAPLYDLTELFERARYGERGLSPDAVSEAERLRGETLAALGSPAQKPA